MTVRLLLTGGPTREHIDPVRFVSNASTGKQAVAIAEEALSRGWTVDLVHGPLEVSPPAGASVHPVTSADQMLRVCRQLHPSCDVLIGAAAVSDYRPAEPLDHKQKRSRGEWIVRLVPTVDILADLSGMQAGRVHVGFALETDDLLTNALRKLRAKGLDLLVANTAEAIGAGESRAYLLDATGSARDLGCRAKRDLARQLLDEVEKILSSR